MTTTHKEQARRKSLSRFALAMAISWMAMGSCASQSYSTSPAKSELFNLSIAGLQIMSGKPHMAFGGAFLTDVRRFTVVHVTDPSKPELLLDIQQEIPRGQHTFVTDPLNKEQIAWLYEPGDSRLNFDVTVVAEDGRSSVLHQGTFFSSGAKSTLRIVIGD